MLKRAKKKSAVSLIAADPELARSLPAERLADAARACVARVVEVPRGAWDPDSLRARGRGHGLLLLSGAFCRRVLHSSQRASELIGPGDLMRPWEGPGEWSSIPASSEWEAIAGCRVAVLDSRFAVRVAPYPELTTSLNGRAIRRAENLAVLMAIIGKRRIDTRVALLFLHLAERFGRPAGEGQVAIPLRLSHRLISEMVAARRPSVSSAIGELGEREALARTNGSWIVRDAVLEELPEESEPPPRSAAMLAGAGAA